MADPREPQPGPGAPGDTDPLRERLTNYFDEVTPQELPPALQRTTLADLRADPPGGGFTTRRLSTPRGQQLGFVLAGVAATVVLVLALFALSGRSGTDVVDIGSPAGTSTTRPPTSTSPAPTSTTPTSTAPTSTVASTTPSTPTSSPTSSAPSTTTTAPSNVLFADDFTADPVGSTPPAGWTVDNPTWLVGTSGGRHYAKSPNDPGSEARLSTGSPSWTDETVNGTVAFGSGPVRGGLAIRYQDPGNYDFCKVDTAGKQLFLGRFQAGVATVLGSKPFPAVAPAVDYPMVLAASGTQLSCSIAGVGSISAADTTWTTGRIALLADGNAGFTSIVVTRP